MLDTFRGRTVLLTGHTGFKGSWLSVWLRELGADVVGIALDPLSQPSHFEVAHLADGLVDRRVDIRDKAALAEALGSAQPDFVFHLAAQPLVRQSYADPVQTYQTNVLGTLHLLEALRTLEKPCVAVLVTSDKCYDNAEWVWGYRETDRLGGPDPYSASKAAAELVIQSHVRSFFSSDANRVRIGIGRAGNVIGGGDWSADRLIPDCVRAWSRDEAVALRNPNATRPWQHVLEPLGGYLVLAAALSCRPELHGEPFNFGPPQNQNHTVLALVQQMARHWDQVRWQLVPEHTTTHHESGLLKLNCDKALQHLQWRAVLGFDDTVQLTAEWYRTYYAEPERIADVTRRQVREYMARAAHQQEAWAQ
jgi:CDP-glucose 4,6-dehydratase